MKIQHYALFACLAFAIICRGIAEDVPGYTKIILDIATIATGLAGLVMRPPWETPNEPPFH